MSQYVMPAASVGDWVYFYPHYDASPVPALVTSASSRTVTLWAVSPGYGGNEKPSVHHVTDPDVEKFPDWKRYGFWEHKPADPKIAILSEKVALLEKRLDGKSGNKQ